ncbi:MAG: isoprenyl transferase [Candidatus Margulisiibacteriota bacterium]
MPTPIIGLQNRTESLDSICQSLNLDSSKMPAHVAVIMDGNGRWAKQRHMPRNFGHKQGAEALRKTIKACVRLGIHHLSVYTFSTENWKRPEGEVSFLMGFFAEMLRQETKALHKEGVRINCLGHLEALDPKLQKGIRDAEAQTQNNQTLQLNLMMNYGSRLELVHAAQRWATDVQSGKHTEADLTEALFNTYLYTQNSPDPDILIRTGGDHRISNFMLWQCAYSEFFVLEDLLWPDFNETALTTIIRQFQTRDRRYGGLND